MGKTSCIAILLSKPHSLRVTKQITAAILEQPDLLNELMQILQTGTASLKQKASWPLAHLAVANHALFSPYLNEIITLTADNAHPAVRRNALKVLEQTETLPGKYHAKLLNSCFRLLQNRHEPVAIRVYAMSVLGRLCEVYPEVRYELQAIIEDEWTEASPGFRSRGNKILKKLQSLPG